jgi:hypothetical protein
MDLTNDAMLNVEPEDAEGDGADQVKPWMTEDKDSLAEEEEEEVTIEDIARLETPSIPVSRTCFSGDSSASANPCV